MKLKFVRRGDNFVAEANPDLWLCASGLEELALVTPRSVSFVLHLKRFGHWHYNKARLTDQGELVIFDAWAHGGDAEFTISGALSLFLRDRFGYGVDFWFCRKKLKKEKKDKAEVVLP